MSLWWIVIISNFDSIAWSGWQQYTANTSRKQCIDNDVTLEGGVSLGCIFLTSQEFTPQWILRKEGRTVRSNKRNIPEELKYRPSKPVGKSMVCFDNLLLSSPINRSRLWWFIYYHLVEDATIKEGTCKPHSTMYCNHTGGVDTLDQMCCLIFCGRKANRFIVCNGKHCSHKGFYYLQ